MILSRLLCMCACYLLFCIHSRAFSDLRRKEDMDRRRPFNTQERSVRIALPNITSSVSLYASRSIYRARKHFCRFAFLSFFPIQELLSSGSSL